MRALTVTTIVSALAIAGCDAGQQDRSAQPVTVRGEAQEQLHRLNDLNRAIGLKRAIYDSGFTCKRITRSGFVTVYENLDMWMASCDDGREWAVFVGPDESVQVRDCRDVEKVGLPRCEITEKEGAGEPTG